MEIEKIESISEKKIDQNVIGVIFFVKSFLKQNMPLI